MATVGAALMMSAPALAGPPEPAAAERANQIGSFDVSEGDKGTLIRIKGTSVPTFSVFKLSDPPRLFVDISNSSLGGSDGDVSTVDNGVITQVAMLGVSDGGQSVTRVIIGFERAAHYDVRTEGNDVVVFIDGQGRRAPGSSKGDVSRAELETQRRQYAEASAELVRTRSKLSDTERELTKLRSDLEKSNGKERAALERKISAKSSALTQAKQERDQALRRLDSLKAERTEAVQRARKLEERATSLEQRATSLESSKTRLEGQLATTQKEADQAARALKKQNQQLDQTRDRIAELERELSTMRDRASKGDASAKSAVASLERERDAQNRKLDAARAETERSKADAEAAKARAVALEDSVAARDQEIAALKARIARADADAKKASETSARDALPTARAVPVDPSAPNVVRDIRLETRNGRSRIVVALDRPGRFETLPSRDARAVMILNDVELPRDLEKTLSSKSQGGAVRFVSSFVDGKHVRMEAELNGQVAETVRHEGNQLVWEFAPSVAAKGAPLEAERDPRRPEAGDTFTSAPPIVVTDPTKVTRVPGMSRKRLTIDLRGADIQNVLRLIAKEGGVNIIAGDDVGGTITMRLRSVPLEQVFLTILQSKGLGFEKRGNVIRVAPQDTLIKEQTARAEAIARIRDNKPLEVFLVPVNYAQAVDLTGQIQGLLSQRGSVSVDKRTNTLIVKDISENLESIRVLVESLDAQVPQVLIEARIVETNDTFTKQLGIQWGGDFAFSQANGNPTGLVFPSVLGVAGGATDNQTPTGGTSNTPNFAVNLPAPVGTGSGGGIGLTMGSVGGAVNLNIRLSALESAGHARIVSSPKILTLDNREATISQGTSIPISVVSAAGVQTVFVQAVLELRVTPHVTPDGNIQLQISASKNEPDFQNTGARGDPTIIRRQAETELLIKDGDTTVIGGIYTRNAGTNLSAVPFFHKIPILGIFFKTSIENERRGELLIFITPRIVNRAESLGAVSTGTVQGGAPPEGGSAGATTGGN